MYTRVQSFLLSVKMNGFFITLMLLAQLILIKLNLRKYINVKGQKVYLRNGTSDFPVFRQIFLENEYEIVFKDQPKYIVDLGANIGLASLYFKLKYKDVKIISVELDKVNFSQMHKNLAHFKDLKLINAAIWSTNGFLNVKKNNELGEWGITANEFVDSNEQLDKIRSVTLEKLIEENRLPYIDLLKIDIEGGESNLFTNTTWLNNIKYVVIELHDRIYPASSNNFIRAISNLERFNIIMKGEKLLIENLSAID